LRFRVSPERKLKFAATFSTLGRERELKFAAAIQCPWQWPPQQPPPPPFPDPALAGPALAGAKTENFLANFAEPQCGQAVPFQSVERTRISLSRPHFSQWNS